MQNEKGRKGSPNSIHFIRVRQSNPKSFRLTSNGRSPSPPLKGLSSPFGGTATLATPTKW